MWQAKIKKTYPIRTPNKIVETKAQIIRLAITFSVPTSSIHLVPKGLLINSGDAKRHPNDAPIIKLIGIRNMENISPQPDNSKASFKDIGSTRYRIQGTVIGKINPPATKQKMLIRMILFAEDCRSAISASL